MGILFIWILLSIALDFASPRWGCECTETLDSPEWERRATWYAHLAGRETE